MAKSSRRSFGKDKPDRDDAASNDALDESGIESNTRDNEVPEIGDDPDTNFVAAEDVDANMVEIAERHAQKAAGEDAADYLDADDLDDDDDDDLDDDDDDDDDDVTEGAAATTAKKKVKDAKKSKAARGKVDTKSKNDTRSKSERRAEPAESRGAVRFVRETYSELTKVVWPTKKQMVTYTIVVMVFVVALIALVGFFDIGVKDLMAKIFA